MALENERLPKIVRENQLDFLYELYVQGIAIGPDNIELLKKNNYIKADFTPKEKEKVITDTINQQLLRKKNDKNIEADSYIDIFETESFDENKIDILTSSELENRRLDYGHVFEGRKTPITRKDWLPKSITEHEIDFVDWINSINQRGFKNKISYRKFNLYCQQAYTWLDENTTSSDFEDEEQRSDYRQQELARCDENALYFLNKYVYYQDGNATDGSGTEKYVARPTHEFLAYIDDCGYSMAMAKGRQQAVTTTIMSLSVRDVIFKVNHFMKFITEDDKKAVEIFEDKLKFPFGLLPDWMRPNILNERDNLFKVGYKEEKGKKEGVGSKIAVDVPKRTAVAGGAPQKVLIDEAGNINILGVMIGNAEPTRLRFNPATGKLESVRKLWFYGTGGEMEKGGKAFETEFMAIQKAWDEGTRTETIPIFFDWTCRVGATPEIYEKEKRKAYAKAENPADPNAKRHITEFYQSWPSSLSDVFRTAAKTLIDEDYIDRAIKRINEAKQKHNFTLHQSGFFEPEYDLNEPTPEGSDTPYKIIGANFIPTEDIDSRASCTIFLQPNREWIDRYYKGTDPIDTDTGLSNFASTIWDDYYNCPAAILNWRIPDYPQVFLQSMLMGIYYDDINKKGIRELLEANRGSAYYQYMKAKGYAKRAVVNFELPDHLQNRTAKNEGVGIDSHGDRTSAIVNLMFQMFKLYGDNFYHSVLFEQAKTFTCVISGGGKEMWGPMNKKYFKDDTLWSTTYSYICAKMCFPTIYPKNIETLKNEVKLTYKTVRGSDLKLKRVLVRTTGNGQSRK